MNELADCPVRECAQRTVELSQDFLISLRQLRKSMRACARCGQGQNCRLIQEWHSQIHEAISEITQEWNLAG